MKLEGGPVGPDNDPPAPDPATWASVPAPQACDAVTMTATTATDISGVEYYFLETSGNSGGDDSAWQDGTGYTDSGLTSGLSYTYEVQARDKSANQNATAWSTSESATVASQEDVHVDSIVCSTVSVGQGNKIGRATVTILDNCGNAAVGYLVTGTFTGDYDETQSGTTDSNGVAVIDTVGTAKGGISFQFCVNSVTGTLSYDATDNVVTCCNN